MMKWFKPKHSVCAECGVHFEPVTGYDARWGNLCAMHRKPIKDRDERKDAVVAWAALNWPQLEDVMIRERTEQSKSINDIAKAMTGNGGYFSQAAAAQGSYSGLCGFGGRM